jgi:hypothetical protein
MPAASTLYSLLGAVNTKITALNLAYNSTPVPIQVLKRPRRLDKLEATPCIVIYRPENPESDRLVTFPNPGGSNWVEYLILVVIYAPGNQDLVTNLDVWSNWRDQIRQAFQPPPGNNGSILSLPILGVTGVFGMRVDPDVFLPASLMSINYDYQAIGIYFKTVG